MKDLSNRFMRLAVFWFVAGLALGVGMAVSHHHGMTAAHAHINLLGWVSMALFAAFYRLWPAAAHSRLARAHFWLFVPSHFVMMAGLSVLLNVRVPGVEAVVGVAIVGVVLGAVCFAGVVWKHTAPGRRAAPAMGSEQGLPIG